MREELLHLNSTSWDCLSADLTLVWICAQPIHTCERDKEGRENKLRRESCITVSLIKQFFNIQIYINWNLRPLKSSMWLLNSKGYNKKKKSCNKYWTKISSHTHHQFPPRSWVPSFTKVDMRLVDAGKFYVIAPEMYRHKHKCHIQIIIIKQTNRKKTHRLTQYHRLGHEQQFWSSTLTQSI